MVTWKWWWRRPWTRPQTQLNYPEPSGIYAPSGWQTHLNTATSKIYANRGANGNTHPSFCFITDTHQTALTTHGDIGMDKVQIY